MWVNNKGLERGRVMCSVRNYPLCALGDSVCVFLSFLRSKMYFLRLCMYIRDVNVLVFLDFSFRYDSVHQKY